MGACASELSAFVAEAAAAWQTEGGVSAPAHADPVPYLLLRGEWDLAAGHYALQNGGARLTWSGALRCVCWAATTGPAPEAGAWKRRLGALLTQDFLSRIGEQIARLVVRPHSQSSAAVCALGKHLSVFCPSADPTLPAVGDAVVVRWRESENHYPATVLAVSTENDTFDAKFFDGTTERAVSRSALMQEGVILPLMKSGSGEDGCIADEIDDDVLTDLFSNFIQHLRRVVNCGRGVDATWLQQSARKWEQLYDNDSSGDDSGHSVAEANAVIIYNLVRNNLRASEWLPLRSNLDSLHSIIAPSLTWDNLHNALCFYACKKQ